jgi:malonyl-CoA/methylmalonyl-CoA synthetase
MGIHVNRSMKAPGLAVDEMASFVGKSHAVAVLTVSTSAALGKRLEEHIVESSKSSFRSIDIQQFVCRPPLSPTEIIISSDLQLDGNGSALVIFTSGTTGPPKGVVKRRAAVHDAALAVAHHYGLSADDVVLHALPVHHASGIGLTLLPFLLSGSCVEFQLGGFDAGSLWERWRQGGLTFFSGVPTIYMKMMQYYEDHLKELPPYQRDSYATGAKQFRGLLCGTAALPRPLQQKWTDLRDGRKILTRYGGTETGAIFKVPLHAVDVPEVKIPQTQNIPTTG